MLNHFLYIHGDNICQIAYWHILLNPHLQGSVGATVPKPALIFLLGPFYDLSMQLFGSPLLISIIILCFAILLVYEVARLSMRIGGVAAGVFSGLFFVFMTPFITHAISGTSMIFYLPILLMGLRLLGEKKYNAGIITLCISALIRPEALAIVVWVAAQKALQRKWKNVFFAFLYTTITIGIMISVSYALQGSISRLSAGGPATGYIFSDDSSSFFSRFFEGIGFVADATRKAIFDDALLRYVGIAAFFTLFFFRHASLYKSIGSIYIFWIALHSFMGWSMDPTYFYFLAPFTVGLGVGGICWILKTLWKQKKKRSIAVVLSLCMILIIMHSAKDAFHRHVLYPFSEKIAVYTTDTMLFLNNPPLPVESRVLTEDDIVYGVIARNPDNFQSANALQFFNIQNDLKRHEILEKTDYIVISKTFFPYYYLWYDPKENGDADPFRKTVHEMLDGEKFTEVYGYCLSSIENSTHWLVISVKKTCVTP